MSDINEIMGVLNAIKNKIDDIDTRLGRIEGENEKLSEHIDFVEEVYSCVKYPFSQIVGLISGEARENLLLIDL